MSLRVLVIGEDPTYNGAILQPVTERLLSECGRPKAVVTVLSHAGSRGYEAVSKQLKGGEMDLKYGHYDLWLYIPDADKAAEEAVSALTKYMGQRAPAVKARFLCIAAAPELETWALAGYTSRLKVSWSKVQNHPKLKEEVFEPLARELGWAGFPGGGRVQMIKQALSNWRGLLERCPELKTLQDRIANFLQTS